LSPRIKNYARILRRAFREVKPCESGYDDICTDFFTMTRPTAPAILGDGKHTLTRIYMPFLARWARRLAERNGRSISHFLGKVFDAVAHVVIWGLEHRTVGQIDAIGVNEIQYAKDHK